MSQPTCADCEYFDGGGERRVEQGKAMGKPVFGDCHNALSPRFTTWSNDTCSVFYPASATVTDED